MTPYPQITEKRVNLGYDGIAWYCKEVVIPATAKGKKLYFRAQIDDYDTVWFNGIRIGKTDNKTPNSYRKYRKYFIPEDIIKYNSKNLIVVKVNDIGFAGGLWINKRMDMKIGIFTDEETDIGPYLDANYNYDPYLFRRW